MVDGVNNVNGLRQTFSNKGMRLADLKDNKLLFDFFKSKGYDESSTIYASDLAKFDTDGKAGISKKEAKAMGLEGSRKEIKEARKLLEQIQNNELEEGTHLVKVDENTTDYYNEDGVRLARHYVKPNGAYHETFTRYDAQGREVLIDTMYPDENGNMVLDARGEKEYDDKGNVKNVHLTYYDNEGNEDNIIHVNYENGKIKEKVDIDKNGIKTTTQYDWFNDTLNSTTETTGQHQTFTRFENGKEVLKVESFTGDPDSAKTTTTEDGITTIKYEGKFIKEGLIKEQTEGDVNTKFYQDGTKIVTNTKTGETQTIVPEPPAQEKPKPEQKPARVLINVPDTWQRVKKDDANWKIAEGSKTVAELADKLIQANAGDIGGVVDKDELIAQLTKFNPSVVDKEGNIRQDKLNKLDMPSIADIRFMLKTQDTAAELKALGVDLSKLTSNKDKQIVYNGKTYESEAALIKELKEEAVEKAKKAAERATFKVKGHDATEIEQIEKPGNKPTETPVSEHSEDVDYTPPWQKTPEFKAKQKAEAEAKAAADAKKLKEAAAKRETVENYRNAFGQEIPQQRRPGDPWV